MIATLLGRSVYRGSFGGLPPAVLAVQARLRKATPLVSAAVAMAARVPGLELAAALEPERAVQVCYGSCRGTQNVGTGTDPLAVWLAGPGSCWCPVGAAKHLIGNWGGVLIPVGALISTLSAAVLVNAAFQAQRRTHRAGIRLPAGPVLPALGLLAALVQLVFIGWWQTLLGLLLVAASLHALRGRHQARYHAVITDRLRQRRTRGTRPATSPPEAGMTMCRPFGMLRRTATSDPGLSGCPGG